MRLWRCSGISPGAVHLSGKCSRLSMTIVRIQWIHPTTKSTETSTERSFAACGPQCGSSLPSALRNNYSPSRSTVHQKLKTASLGNDEHHPEPLWRLKTLLSVGGGARSSAKPYANPDQFSVTERGAANRGRNHDGVARYII